MASPQRPKPKPKPKETVLDLCTRATLLGNNISVRMLEFLTTVKHQPHNFPDLAGDFLDTCRVLWTIEAGLAEAARAHREFPAEVVAELDAKFRQTNADFSALDHVMFQFMEYEKKGAVGRLQRGWRMMFADKEIYRMRESLQRARTALKMSALVFQWSLGGDAQTPPGSEAAGSGYAGLAAALDRMGKSRVTVKLAKAKSFEGQTTQHQHHKEDHDEALSPRQTHALPSPPLPSLPSEPPHIPAPSLGEKMPMASDFVLHDVALTSDPRRRLSLSNRSHHSASEHGGYGLAAARTVDRRVIREDIGLPSPAPSPGHLEMRPRAIDNRSLHDTRSGRDDITISDLGAYEVHSTRVSDRRMMRDDILGTTPSSAETDTLIDDLHGLTTHFPPPKVVRLKADPMTTPRWTPRHSTASTVSLKSALVAAVHSKNHKMVEQLLDRGVSPDTGPEPNVLVDAVLSLDAEAVRLLLLFGADANSVDKDGITPLLAAVEASGLELGRTLLKYSADPNLSAGPGLESPLAAAVADGKVDFVQLLLTYGGDPNHVMASGNTVLISAMNKTTPRRLVDLMLAYGSDPNEKNREGKTALFEAIQAGRVDLLTALLDHGANPNLPGPKHMLWPATYQPGCLKVLLARGADSRKSPGNMELAVSINRIDSVKLLLDAGVDPNVKKDGIYTPLCTAIRDNRSEILTLLLSKGADPNLMASEYPAFKCVTHFRGHFLPQLVAAGANLHEPKGIIETAVRVNNLEALMWLLDAGASPNDRTPEGHTALTTAIRENRPEVVDELLLHGADPNVRGEDWPLVMAVKQPDILAKLLPAVPDPRAFKGLMERAVVANQLASVRLLLKAGVSVEDRNGGVFSPLTSAIREDNKTIVRFLLDEAGADPNAPGEHLPLVKAVRRCRGDDTEILEMVLAKGADPNKLYRGWNAVMQAVENGDSKILSLLVKAVPGGADLEARDETGRTVMEIAAARGLGEAMGDLLRSGKEGIAK